MDNQDLGPARTFFAYMEAVMASDLTPSQRLVLLVQAKHADAHDDSLTNSYPSEDTLARETGLNRKTIQRTRKSLVELGWLDQTHCGRGGNSNKSNAYDLYIPEADLARLRAARAKRHGVSLQSDMVSRQSDIESQAKRHSVPTSTPSSSPVSSPLPSSGEDSRGELEGKDGRVSYWVGYSRNRPEGYFHRIDSATVEPKGAHVLVTLTGQENDDLFGCYGGDYEALRNDLLARAWELGLRPPSRPALAVA